MKPHQILSILWVAAILAGPSPAVALEADGERIVFYVA